MMSLLRRIFSVDLRALAWLRISIGALLLADLASRLPDLVVFYTRDGLFPVRYIQTAHFASKHFQIYRLFDAPWSSYCLFFLSAVAALGLLIGYRTRLSLVVAWFLLASLHNRNPFVLDMGDVYLRIVMLWCIFLPMGARYSVDSLRNPGWKLLPNAYCSLASAGYILQVSVVYYVAGILKSDPMWTRTGDALFYTLSIDQFSTGFAQTLLHYPTFLRPFSFLALAMELSAAFLICSPYQTERCRLAAVSGLACLHLGIATCLHLGLLVPICVCMLVGLLPGQAMDGLTRILHEPLQRLRARFQGLAATVEDTHPGGYRLSHLVNGFLVTFIVYTFVQNAITIPQLNIPLNHSIILPIGNYGRLFSLLQDWHLFAPRPFIEDGWFILEGYRQDGQIVDLLRQGQPSSQSFYKPALVSAQFKNQRWRRYYQNLWRRENPRRIPFYCKWQMQRWNSAHAGPEQLLRTRLVFAQETTQPPGLPLKLESYVLGEYPSADFVNDESDCASQECTCFDHMGEQKTVHGP